MAGGQDRRRGPSPPGQSRPIHRDCQACCCPGSGSLGRHSPFQLDSSWASQACSPKPTWPGLGFGLSCLNRQLLGR